MSPTQYHASIAHLTFNERFAQALTDRALATVAAADQPEGAAAPAVKRLSREEVQAKYSPTPDPLWTAEIEAAFFAELPARSRRDLIELDTEKEMLLREFAKETLKAQRMSAAYISTLSNILGKFAGADEDGAEFLVSQRAEELGTSMTVRTIQGQLFNAGVLINQTRAQGKGFVGGVFVYSPKPPYRHRKATPAYLEKSYREHEGEWPSHSLPVNLLPEDVPY